MLAWNKQSVKDNNGFWVDYMSEDNKFIIVQGYDEYEKIKGFPWTLFNILNQNKWKKIKSFPNPDAAKSFLESPSSMEAQL